MENAIDAGATSVEVTLVDGGKSLMTITDNGKGMSKDELPLAVERHATSKLPDNNLFNIHYLGFRGEAHAFNRVCVALEHCFAGGGQRRCLED